MIPANSDTRPFSIAQIAKNTFFSTSKSWIALAMAAMYSLTPLSALAENPLANQPKIILWPAGVPDAIGSEPEDTPELAVYQPAPDRKTTTAMIVCPGGGYGGLADGHEGHDIGEWLASEGITAFILKYRLAPRYRHPAPLDDAQRAIQTVRSNADEYGIDPARIGLLGFSAGGHLASTTGTRFLGADAASTDPVRRVSSRPDFLVLCYPVITFTDPHTHAGSRSNLLGSNPDPQLLASLCNENAVSKDTPPTFLFHTSQDGPVPAQNSLLFYNALLSAGVPAELHVYEKGVHGVGLAKTIPGTNTWPARALDWMRGHELLPAR